MGAATWLSKDVVAQRAAFLKWQRRRDPNRLVFLDEAGANLAMGRSYVWVQRGEEDVEPRPMNWADKPDVGGRDSAQGLGRAQHEVARHEHCRLRDVGSPTPGPAPRGRHGTA